MAYKIGINRVAQKQILSLSKQVQAEITQSIDCLVEDPRPSGCKKLHGTDLWRLRVGRYRLVYFIDSKDQKITIIKVASRREDTYRGL